MKLREMDEHTTYLEQLQEDDGPVVLINQFAVPPEDAERFLEVWADDAAFMKQQPGFISTQRHRRKWHLHERGRLGVRKGTRPGLPFPRVPGTGGALPRRRCRRTPCL